MMEVLIASLLAIIAIPTISNLIGHKHDWVYDREYELDSIYSDKKVSIYEIYKCTICGKPQVMVFERKKNG